MTQTSKLNSITFLDLQDFLQHDPSKGRLDRTVEGGVTLSAVPQESGSPRYEARTEEGKLLPIFHMTLSRPTGTAAATATAAAHPVFVDAMEGCFVCYEDEAAQQSWCMHVPCG